MSEKQEQRFRPVDSPPDERERYVRLGDAVKETGMQPHKIDYLADSGQIPVSQPFGPGSWRLFGVTSLKRILED